MILTIAFYGAILSAIGYDFYKKIYNKPVKVQQSSPFNFTAIIKNIYSIFAINKDVSENEIKEKNAPYRKLGDYRSITIPLMVTFCGISLAYYANYSARIHPATESLPLQGNFPVMVGVTTLYIVTSLVWGPRMMIGRQAFNIKKLLMVYNIFQVILSAYMFYEYGVSGWFGRYNYLCEDVKYSLEPMDVRMANVGYIYYFSKILDFADTMFFILTKKWTHLSVLHVIHHSNMFSTLWFSLRYVPVGQITFAAFINTFIHMVMYSYYLLSSLGPAVRPFLWWKKYITTLQLIQFVIVFFHSLQGLVTGCTFSRGMTYVTLYYSIIFFILFMDFYQKSYHQTKKASMSKEKIINGEASNPINDGFSSMNDCDTISKSEKTDSYIGTSHIRNDKVIES